jgi:hypothetical protein
MKNRCPVCNKREAHCDYCCTPALRALVRAAVARWRAHRPLGWTEAEYLRRPTVLLQQPGEFDEARAVARYLAEKKKEARDAK